MGCSLSSAVFRPPKNKRELAYQLSLQSPAGLQVPAVFVNRGKEYTLLISHGNAENLSHALDWANRVLAGFLNVNFMLYEYTGYSASSCSPSEQSVYTDSEAALTYLTEVQEIPRNRVILYGKSIGSGPSCYLAEKYSDLAGMILHSPITSVFRVLLEFNFTLPGDLFPNIDRIKRISIPVLFLHGTRDEVVSMNHSKLLFKHARSEHKQLQFFEGAGHNNLEWVGGPDYFEALQQFLSFIQTHQAR